MGMPRTTFHKHLVRSNRGLSVPTEGEGMVVQRGLSLAVSVAELLLAVGGRGSRLAGLARPGRRPALHPKLAW